MNTNDPFFRELKKALIFLVDAENNLSILHSKVLHQKTIIKELSHEAAKLMDGLPDDISIVNGEEYLVLLNNDPYMVKPDFDDYSVSIKRANTLK